jgi:hypothetical protein
MAEKNSKGIFDLSGAYDRQVARYFPATPTLTPESLNRNTALLIQGQKKNSVGFQNKTLVDSSGNGLAITSVGTPTQGSFSPFSPVGWSAYFNGSTDAIEVAYGTTFGSGSSASAITIEAWFNTSTPSVDQTIVSRYTDGNSGVAIRTNASKLLIFLNGNTSNITGTTTLLPNTWYHVALSGSVGNWKLFLNGVQEGSTYTGSVNLGGTAAFQIGRVSNVVYFNGYISNVRILNGVVLYTTYFTPPTSPLTAIPGTVLLTCQDNRFKDNSPFNITPTVAGTPRSIANSPFNQTVEYDKNIHGTSGYFNGTTDYLSMPGSVLTSSGSVTIEAWVYLTGTSLVGLFDGGSGQSNIIRNYPGNVFGWQGNDGSGANVTGQYPFNQWFHIAVTYSAGSIKTYFNGIPGAIGTYSSTTYDAGSTFNVGGINNGNAGFFKGYISSYRVTKSLVYTSRFTPPTGLLTAIPNTSLLLNFDNAAIYDKNTNTNLITAGDAKLSSAVTKFNPYSMYFDGTGDYVLISDATDLLLAGDFTVEAWVYATSFSGNPSIFTIGTEGAGRIVFFFNSDGKIRFDVHGSSGTTGYTTVVPTINTWNHIAFTRSGSTVRGFVNGALAGTTTSVSTAIWGNATRAVIGADGSLASPLNGYIDDLRITRGVARYTSAFTPAPLEQDKTLALEVLVVAGGGGGGRKRTAGGGAGGLLYYGNNKTTKIPNGPPIIAYSGASYSVAVGLGGATNVSGANSSFGSYVSYGGQGNNSTVIGGSSAGVGTKLWTQGQGQGGGVTANGGQGGGGGAATQGGTGGVIATNTGGSGGNGYQYPEFALIGGVPAGYFAGGGGGGGLLADAASGGPGGLGGGGYGGNVYGSQTKAYGYDGNAYTGGGGGGTSDVHSSQDNGLGAQGGSGIVIVSYAGTSALATGGTISTTVRPGYVCHTFTGAGTFAVT